MPHDPPHDPPVDDVLDAPLVAVKINEHWWSHVMGLFSVAADEDYWASDNERGRDSAVEILDLMAKGNAPVFDPLSAHIRRTTNQSIPNNTNTNVIFDTEITDVGDLFDVGTPDRILLTEPGIWICGGGVRWASNVTGTRQISLTPPGVGSFVVDERIPTSGGYDHPITGRFLVTTATFLRMKVLQTSGVALNIQPLSNHAIDLWAHYLGPI